MFWSDAGYLCALKTNADGSPLLDSLNKPIKQFEKRMVFCNKKSVRQSEFYQAQAQGFKPELMFEVKAAEYNDEQYFEYNGKMYNVKRTYAKTPEIMELVCSSMVVSNGE